MPDYFQREATDQAEGSSSAPSAASVRTRMLIELQVISHLLAKNMEDTEDLAQLRRSIALSISD